eukprot:SAG22_NODE_5448_length_1012_cov_1.355969_2_plen_117_part_00
MRSHWLSASALHAYAVTESHCMQYESLTVGMFTILQCKHEDDARCPLLPGDEVKREYNSVSEQHLFCLFIRVKNLLHSLVHHRCYTPFTRRRSSLATLATASTGHAHPLHAGHSCP